MMLYAEIHHTVAEDVESEAPITAFDMDRETFMSELPKLLNARLEQAAEGDEFIVTLTVRDLEE